MESLKKGDIIGIFTPSSPATVTAKQRFKRAKSFLEAEGFVLMEGKLTGRSDGYRSGSPKERAEELNELVNWLEKTTEKKLYKNEWITAIVALQKGD